MTTAPAAPRTRTRHMADSPTGEQTYEQKIEEHANNLRRLKIAQQKADDAFNDEKAKAFALMNENPVKAKNAQGKMEYTSPARGDTPAVTLSIMQKTTSTVDIVAYKKLVSAAVFVGSVTVGVTEAKKHVTGDQLEKIISKSSSAAYLEVKVAATKKAR